MWRLICVYSVCKCPCYGTRGKNGLIVLFFACSSEVSHFFFGVSIVHRHSWCVVIRHECLQLYYNVSFIYELSPYPGKNRKSMGPPIHHETLGFRIYLYHSLGNFSRRQIYILFFQKTCFDSSCKLSPKETIWMKCQSLFSGKSKKKYYKMSSAEIIIQHAKG